MPTPSYILQLRQHHGHDLLLLPGVSAVVLDGEDERPADPPVRRSDTGRWSLPAGIVEPGEQPARTMVRELAEEACIVARVDRLALLVTDQEITYANGDRCQYVAMAFRCSYVSGEAAVGDEESTEVQWFPLDDLPELSARDLRRIAAALPEHGETIFEGSGARPQRGRRHTATAPAGRLRPRGRGRTPESTRTGRFDPHGPKKHE